MEHEKICTWRVSKKLIKEFDDFYSIYLKDFNIENTKDAHVYVDKEDITFTDNENEEFVYLTLYNKRYKVSYYSHMICEGNERERRDVTYVDVDRIVQCIKSNILDSCWCLSVDRKYISDSQHTKGHVNIIIDLPERLWRVSDSCNCMMSIFRNQCIVYDNKSDEVLILLKGKYNKNQKTQFRYLHNKLNKWCTEYEDAEEFMKEVLAARKEKERLGMSKDGIL